MPEVEANGNYVLCEKRCLCPFASTQRRLFSFRGYLYNSFIMQLPVRKHVCLPDYDYSNPGGYLVTICTHARQNMFGIIHGDMVEQSQFGHIVDISWQNMPSFFDITLDEYVVMPNHFHAIVWINDRSITTKASQLIAIIQTFKSLATKRIHKIQKSTKSVIWQRSFYESIIRDEVHLNTARAYIQANPMNWKSDLEFME